MNKPALLYLLVILFTFSGCSTSESNKQEAPVSVPEPVTVEAPVFNADSAYSFVARQVAFGPRVPNTAAHQKAAEFFIKKFESYGANVISQDFQASTWDGKQVQLKNIIASFYPNASRRILLGAHWDSRPFADKDDERKDEPIDAANDGASGVGVLLEIARVLNESQPPGVGIDIILFDGEDWGNDATYQEYVPTPPGQDSWWCLGSQYWGKNPHTPNYTAYYGILLDMVGGKNATFYRESYSMQVAPSIVEKVWKTAARNGYSSFFVSKNGGMVEDDHVYVNRYRNIPMIDIIPTDASTNSFGSFHHTHDDNMEIIAPETLKAVGQTVLQVLYNEGAAM